MTLFRKVLLSCLVAGVQGHGRLTKPLSRKGDLGYENDPVNGGATADEFVCRHASRNTQVPYTQVTAGSSLTLQWKFGALHVGDCAVYLSYDVASARSAQKYFKIANLPNCKDQTGQDVTITIPDFLPAGNAILRWDWYALHVSPSIEFYNQCADIQITSTSTVQVSQLTTYSIINPAVYPPNGQTGVGFRSPFNTNTEQFMTGPACAHGYTGNNCALTAVGTTGNTRSGGAALTGGGTSSTSSTAATTSSTSTTSAATTSSTSTATTTPAAATTTTTTVGSVTTTTATSSIVAVCSGAPCSDVTRCRSKWGYCGTSPWYCNGESTWKIDGCGSISPGCSGAACSDSTMCRSRWGYCGSSSLYCNDMSTWKANGCTQNRFSALSLVNGTNSSYANSDGTVLSKASSSFSGIITSLVLMCILFSM